MSDRIVITQEMIRLYDEYTHLTLDRRRFMERLTALAGSGAAAAAIAPLLAASSASAEMVAATDDRLTGEDVVYGGSAGEMKGYLVRPKAATGPLGTVIVIHENRGLNPHIRRVARQTQQILQPCAGYAQVLTGSHIFLVFFNFFFHFADALKALGAFVLQRGQPPLHKTYAQDHNRHKIPKSFIICF